MSSVEAVAPTTELALSTWVSADEFPWECVPDYFAQCLQDSESLTQRWRTLSQGNLHHELSYEGWQECRPEESLPLASDDHSAIWAREIIFYGNSTPWEWAKTIIPDSSLIDEGLAFINLGNKPIGDILFTDPHLSRSQFEVAQLDVNHPYSLSIKERLKIDFDCLWARRSVFYFHKKPLLIYEVFLPAALEAMARGAE